MKPGLPLAKRKRNKSVSDEVAHISKARTGSDAECVEQ